MYFFGKKHSLGWDRLAGASAEIGTAFVAVTLVIGAVCGRYWVSSGSGTPG